MSDGDWLSASVSGLFNLGNTALGFVGNRQNYKYQQRLQDDAQRHQIKMMKSAHQWEVGDLRKAGLNPILSAGGSPGSYSSAAGHYSGQPVTGFDENTARRVERAIWNKSAKEDKILDETIKKLKAESDSYSALANKYNSDAFNTDLHSAFEFSRDVMNLKKRELYNRGTPDLSKGYGHFKDEVDRFNNYAPYNNYDKGESIWNMRESPRRQNKDRFYFQK